ncbi:ATP-binding protein [Marinomonas sp. 15G1-11]|uniref:histidine kinase n=1 Tax=Marinomonas phaeophyticola TaxID=3004091 RepID=A0ABT4JWM8_9GAMM|nr:ATP-binding protein [Marinomonas sp. 15G1-11]MCZ2722208.1 ATP-binding protein [Marinomonas sp. 15G1-11]
MVSENLLSQALNPSKCIEEKFRIIGFKVIFILAVLIAAVVFISSPSNIFIAIIFPAAWFTLSSLALYKPSSSQLLARVWVIFTVPLVPFLVLSNGIIPATLVSLGAILPALLVGGLWRVVAALTLAFSTLLVPFSELSYDSAVWVRLCIANITITVVILIILNILEKTLIISLENTTALETALEGQRRASNAQSLFLATMSHEIRTPMNGMLGLLDAVLEDELPKKQRIHLEKVQRSSYLLQNILNGILDYSKLNAGKLIFEAVPVSVRQLISDTESIFQIPAKNKAISLTYYIDPQLADAHLGDPTRIAQILNNLLSNAIKFTHKGSVSLSLSVISTSNDSQQLTFCVRDTGIGVSDEEKTRIFSPFMQANQSTKRNFDGTGLGLQIVKSLVEQMQGAVWVESQEKVGSQFYVTLTLPLTSDLPVNIDQNSLRRNQRFMGKVLVVEDNEINRFVAQELLKTLVDDVSYAKDGQEAVELVKKETFDLIFMDLNMPNMDGFEATQLIRKENKVIPIVALTAAVLADEVEKALWSGMNGHLAKPIDRDKLFHVLARYLLTEGKN